MSRDLSHTGDCSTGFCVENISSGESRTREAESTVGDEDRQAPRGQVTRGLDLILKERSHWRVLRSEIDG